MDYYLEFRRPSPIERLSVELLRLILSALPDVVSLQAAALSCPLFYHAFSKVETSITTQVLLNQIDTSVFPEAVAASESAWLHPHNADITSRKAIEDFVANNLHRRPVPPKSWPLHKALHLATLHFCVEDLARKFALAALTEPPLVESGSPAALQEICRIQRALYRFEIYCNLFRGSTRAQSSIYGEQNQLFFANFTPWEIEQLGCVHDFLARTIAPAFNDIAEHDVAWGAFHVEYGDKVDSPYIQHVLSLGLRKLSQIATAEKYEERYRLLYSSRCPPATHSFLQAGLQGANEANDNVFLDDLSPEDEAGHIKKPFFADPDPGPEEIWRWVHQEESWANWVYQENRHDLRRWGYVIWDRSRLESIGIFREPWQDLDRPDDSLLAEQEAIRQRGFMENSWEKRERIYMSGGTGWWSWGDESKVRWRDRAMPGHRSFVPARSEPGSLREAQDMLAMLKLPSSVK